MSEFSAYASKEISPTLRAFGEWILEVVYEGTLPEGLPKDDFLRAVALGGSLRSPFQKSEWWKGHPDNYLANVEARKAAKARERLVAAEAAAAKSAARIEAARKAVEAAEAAEAAKAAPVAEEAPVESAPRRGRRAA